MTKIQQGKNNDIKKDLILLKLFWTYSNSLEMILAISTVSGTKQVNES